MWLWVFMIVCFSWWLLGISFFGWCRLCFVCAMVVLGLGVFVDIFGNVLVVWDV